LYELEKLCAEHKIKLFYGDESHVCTEGYVPYGWQFPDEDVCILSGRAARLNCFAMISRNNECFQFTTQEKIDAPRIMDFLESFSFNIRKETFLVLDNAAIHRAKCIRERIPFWQNRGLYLFYLPVYSPHLNITETVWRKLKGQWIRPEDYICKEQLFYATRNALADIGKNIFINFKHIDN
jgi:transposase